MANYGIGLGAFAQGFAGGVGLGQKWQESQRRNDDRAAIDKINSDTKSAFEAGKAEGKVAPDIDYVSYWTKTAGPQMLQHAISSGDMERASSLQKYIEGDRAKAIANNFGAALAASQSGDMDASIGAFDNYMTNTPFKGYVYGGTQKVDGPDGKPMWSAVFRGPDGKSYSQTFATPTDIQRVLTTYAYPEKAAELAMQRDQEIWKIQHGLAGRETWSPVPAADAKSIGLDGVPLQRASSGKIEKIGGSGVSVNVGGGEGAFDKKAGEEQAKLFSSYVEQGDLANEMLSDLQSLRDLAQAGVTTGKGAEMTARLGPWLQPIVGDIQGLSGIQAYEAITSRVAPKLRVPGSGTTSDRDLALFLRSIPSIGNTPEGNAMVTQTMEGLAARKQRAGDIAAQALAGKMSREDAMKQIRELPDPLVEWRRYNQSRPSGAPAATAAAPARPAPRPAPVAAPQRVAPPAQADEPMDPVTGQPLSALPRPSTPQERAGLPKGQRYVDPNGEVRTAL